MNKTCLDGTGLGRQLLICTLGQSLLEPRGHAVRRKPWPQRGGGCAECQATASISVRHASGELQTPVSGHRVTPCCSPSS